LASHDVHAITLYLAIVTYLCVQAVWSSGERQTDT